MFKLSDVSIKKRFSIDESLQIIEEATKTKLNINELIEIQEKTSTLISIFHIDFNKLTQNEQDLIRKNINRAEVYISDDFPKEAQSDTSTDYNYIRINSNKFSFKVRKQGLLAFDKFNSNRIVFDKPIYTGGIFRIAGSLNRDYLPKLEYENGNFFFKRLLPTTIDETIDAEVRLMECFNTETNIVKDFNKDKRFFKWFSISLELSVVSKKNVFIFDYDLEEFINKILFPQKESNLLTESKEYVTIKGINQDKVAQFIDLLLRLREKETGEAVPTYSELHTILSANFPKEAIPSKNTIRKYLTLLEQI